MPKKLSDYRTEENPNGEAELRQTVEELRGKSDEELFSQLQDVTKQQRQTGELDDLKMEQIYEKLAPMLTDAQKEKMRQVIQRLRD